MYEAVYSGTIAGNGGFTKLCQGLIEEVTSTQKCLLTTSCTDALEMSAILAGIEPGDEVIMPSYTFVSTANAFILRGAKVIFGDSRPDHPGIDEAAIESLITSKTKAIVPVHYAGVACDMGQIMAIAEKNGIFVIEDAAQAIDSYYQPVGELKQALGTIGMLGSFSFHETKNIQCGEGGALLINEASLMERAEIIWEKGTNRTAFWRGEVDKYGWVDIGSSFLPSELSAAFLYAQLEHIHEIQNKRKSIWNQYQRGLKNLFDEGKVRGPHIPGYATNNAHMFYIVCESEQERINLIAHLREKEIISVFHYQSLHQSSYFKGQHGSRNLHWADTYTDCLLRLPLHFGLSSSDVERVINEINIFFSYSK